MSNGTLAGNGVAVTDQGNRSTSESQMGNPDALPNSSMPTILKGAKWARMSDPYEIRIITADNKGKKFHGVKQFTVFEVTDMRTNVSVERRFKHFVWLHDQLTRIYPHFNVPQLPGKQVSGRFEHTFIERRRRALQRFLERIARHPVMGASAVVLHFLTADDHKNWKAGKRLSEQIPPVLSDITVQPGGEKFDADGILSRTTLFMQWVGKQLGAWHGSGEDLLMSFHSLALAYEKMAQVLMQFSGPTSGAPEYSEWWDGGRSAGEFTGLLMSLARFGSGVERIARMITKHQELQGVTILEFLKEYSGLAKTLPSLSKVVKRASADQSEADGDTTSGIMLAELRFFHESLIADFRRLVSVFIQEQISFHRQAADTWESLLPDFVGDE